jgi:ATP-dependent RNA helicase DeaD
MVPLLFDCGKAQGIRPADIVGVIAGVTRLGKEADGAIRIGPHETRVDVAAGHVKLVLKKLNGITFKGRKLRVKAESTDAAT